MPKVVFDFEKKRNARVAVILAWLTERGLEWKDLAMICGFSERTARNRKKHPERFTVEELSRLVGLSNYDTHGIIFGVRS